MPRERIVVADDIDDIRHLCQRALQAQGYLVYEARNGEEAIQLASEHPIDLLITDLRMPRMAGLEAYRRMRELQPELMAIVMTGYGSMESAIEALKLGAYEFLLKPFSPRDLVTAVERTLSRRRLETQNARLKAFIPLFDLGQVATNVQDLKTLSLRALEIAREEMGASIATLVRLEDHSRLALIAAIGCNQAQARDVLGKSRASSDMSERHEPIVLDAEAASEWRRLLASCDTGPALVQPMLLHDRVLGFISVARQPGEPSFAQDEIEFLSVLASQVAIALENARLLQEIRDAYDRLAEIDHLKSEFISIAAHELRTPLAVILAYATLLEEEATGTMQEHLGQVVLAAMQLKSIIDEMVSLRRIDTGQQQVELTNVALDEVAARVVDELQPIIHQKAHQVTVDIPAETPTARADKQVVSLILGNIVSNAIKFTPPEGSIHISAAGDDHYVTLCVRDSGVGIPEDQLERVFDRFYQVEASLRRRHGGIGLGLAVAREMAELVDGQLWAESPADGGAAFYLRLPRS
ncbi:MAG: response regulator [Anaerolineae bacterium]|nr:response regulator [Anaerolineae bacterium]